MIEMTTRLKLRLSIGVYSSKTAFLFVPRLAPFTGDRDVWRSKGYTGAAWGVVLRPLT
jgi:hypothetical protein